MTARPRLAFALAALGALACAALVPAAFLAPAYSGETCSAQPGGGVASCTAGTATLFAENGWLVVAYALGVAGAALLAFLALHRACSRGSRRAVRTAEVLVASLLAFAVVAAASVGLFVVPGALLLLAAAALTPLGAHGD